ncbi:hypothetical protein LX36DRAFT_474265 [Colletotrichum falcatum]|nr:hypothetical protein LX36DRAFT_474265 [Colletotrichum falcatum]
MEAGRDRGPPCLPTYLGRYSIFQGPVNCSRCASKLFVPKSCFVQSWRLQAHRGSANWLRAIRRRRCVSSQRTSNGLKASTPLLPTWFILFHCPLRPASVTLHAFFVKSRLLKQPLHPQTATCLGNLLAHFLPILLAPERQPRLLFSLPIANRSRTVILIAHSPTTTTPTGGSRLGGYREEHLPESDEAASSRPTERKVASRREGRFQYEASKQGPAHTLDQPLDNTTT